MMKFSPSPPTQIMPIKCDRCGGNAHLIRRGPDAFKRDGKTEVRVFRCAACGHEISVTVST
jgi:uncharacterized Zn finger protein